MENMKMKYKEDLQKFNELVKNQFIYGGQKYAATEEREATDILFDVHGKNWLFGTMDKYCYDERTEILTDKGWKYFKDLDKTEQVATLNPDTNEIIYQKPLEYQKLLYTLPYIYQIENTYIDLVVTPFHSIFYRGRNDKNYKLGDIENIFHAPKGRYYFKLTGKYNGKELKTFCIPIIKKLFIQTKIKNYSFLMEDWVELLGWFLSEGYTSRNEKSGHYIIGICQSINYNKKKYKEIESLLNKLKLKFFMNENGFRIYDKTIYTYFSQFGKSENKFIPQEFKELSSKLLFKLLLTLIKGDGTERKNKYYQYFTVSKQLADDVQEIAFKLGFHTHIGRIKTKNFNGFNIYIRTHQETLIKEIKKIKLDNEIYVYDVTVPKYHILYVRRNFKACWSGNCYRFHNLERERDLLKIATYCFILYLKKGFFIKKNGLTIDVLDTNIEMKNRYFPIFINDVNLYLEGLSVRSLLANIENYKDNVKMKYISEIFQNWSKQSWDKITIESIIGVYYCTYLIWFTRYLNVEKHDEDNLNISDKK